MWKLTMSVSAGAILVLASAQAQALVVTNTTDGTALLNALLPNTTGFVNPMASYTFGAATQVGTFTGFTSGPVTLPGGGVVLSTGVATQTTAAFKSTVDSPSNSLGGGSTPEITAYAPGRVANFSSGNDAARVTLSFTLANASAIAFDFVFGSVEYPTFVSTFTDAAYVFLDGQQISFDANGVPVQVGSSFSSMLTTADTNTAFAGVHGLIGPLTTTSGSLAAGQHTLQFEVADTNDTALDSALFVSNLRLATSTTGPVTTGTTPVTTNPTAVPEPASLVLLGTGLVGAGVVRRRRTTLPPN